MTNIEMLEKLIKESGCVELWDHNTDDFIKPDPVEALAKHLDKNGVTVINGWCDPNIEVPCDSDESVIAIIDGEHGGRGWKCAPVVATYVWDDGWILSELPEMIPTKVWCWMPIPESPEKVTEELERYKKC